MQIKQFYLDLREGPQYAKRNHDVWLLESEAFKEPLKFIWEFEESDKRRLEEIEQSCKEQYEKLKRMEKEREEKIKQLEERYMLITKSYQEIEELKKTYQVLDGYLRKETKKQDEEISIVEKAIKDILDELFRLESKIDSHKETNIYHFSQEMLVSGDEVHYGEDIKIPSGKYVIIQKKKYIPQNEYVGIKEDDELTFRVEYVEGVYNPEAQIWSTNGTDKPICKVVFDILFFQI